jgi:hypothetical protein
VPKFICTTLHPSLPPCPELYDIQSCAKFVSEFLTYEPLANPLHPPTHLPSPTSVLAWQTADSFDASVVLCSLLLGAGYNAFVVMGYAPLHVTVNDQSQAECLLLQQQQPVAWWSAPAGAAAAAAAVSLSASGAKGQASGNSGSGSGTATAGSGLGGSNTAGNSSTSPGSNKAASTNSGATKSAAAAASDELGKRSKYQVRPKPDLFSAYLQQHLQQEQGVSSDDELAAQDTDAMAASVSQVGLIATPSWQVGDLSDQSAVLSAATQQQTQQLRCWCRLLARNRT